MARHPEMKGDGPCSTCGTKENLVWFTQNAFWNAVVRADLSPWNENEPTLCIPCFVQRAYDVGFRTTGWELSPEWPWRQI